MRNGWRVQAAGLVFFVAIALPASAVEPIKPASPGALKPGNAPLKGPLKLDPKSLHIKKFAVMPRRDELERAWDDFRRKYGATLAAISRYEKRTAECLGRSYSVEDQRNAGCRSGDSVTRCNQKLFSYCAKDAETAQNTTWTQMQMSAATLRQKVLRFSNDPIELK